MLKSIVLMISSVSVDSEEESDSDEDENEINDDSHDNVWKIQVFEAKNINGLNINMHNKVKYPDNST